MGFTSMSINTGLGGPAIAGENGSFPLYRCCVKFVTITDVLKFN